MKKLHALFTPPSQQRQFDERAQQIDLLAYRDTCFAVLVLVVLLPFVGLIPPLRSQSIIAWDMFPALILVVAAVVLTVSRKLRGGKQWPYSYRLAVAMMLGLPGSSVIFLVLHVVSGKPPLSLIPGYIVLTLIVSTIVLLIARGQKQSAGE